MDNTSANSDPDTISPQLPENKNQEIHIAKHTLWLALSVLIIILALLFGWQLGLVSKILLVLNPATAEIVVSDTESQKTISGAKIKLFNQEKVTDTNGKTSFAKLRAGNQTIEITATGYEPLKQSIKLKRGANLAKFNLTIHVEKVTVNGVTKDYVDGEIIGEVKITLGDQTITSSSDGAFSVNNIATGEIDITTEKAGYEKKTTKYTIVNGKQLDVLLVPTGKVVFTSNRDSGKRGLYVANLDGSDVKQLVQRVDNTEDFSPIISPDNKKVAFLSTREQRKNETSVAYEPSLYLISIDGKDLVQLSKEFGISNIVWTSNTKYLAWASRQTASEYTYHTWLYPLDTKKIERINGNGLASYVVFNHAGTAVAWNQSEISGNPTSEIGMFYRELKKTDTKKINDTTVSDILFAKDDKTLEFTIYDSTANKKKWFRYTIASDSKLEYEPEVAQQQLTSTVSPDGKYYAYTSSRDGKRDVYISDKDGKNEKRLTTDGNSGDTNPYWINSKYIVFNIVRSGETAKYIVGLTGQTPKKIADIHIESGYTEFY